MDLIARGGFMMIPLLLSALAALTVIIERAYVWTVRLRRQQGLASEAESAVVSGDLSTADSLRKKFEGQATPTADVLAAGLSRVRAPIDDVERVMQTRAEAWIPALERRLEILDTIVTAAPLMGLLGTITGMMAAFRSLSDAGANGATRAASDAQAVTGGVAEALIATATGLVIALVCLFAYNYFQNRVRAEIFAMENAAARLLDALRSARSRGTSA